MDTLIILTALSCLTIGGVLGFLLTAILVAGKQAEIPEDEEDSHRLDFIARVRPMLSYSQEQIVLLGNPEDRPYEVLAIGTELRAVIDKARVAVISAKREVA
jgi:hypothetical protein